MKILLRTCAAMLAAGVLVSTSAAFASNGVHWSPTFATGSHFWSDHHGRQLNIVVNFFNATWTTQTAGSTTTHGAAAICSLNGVPAFVQYGNIAAGAALSGAGCPVGYTNPFGAGATQPF